jgi:hypothetical protein
MYTKEIKLNDNEIAGRINVETGEITPLGARPNNLPKDKSKLKYDSFSIVNINTQKLLQSLFNHEEYSIINYMISLAEINTNSLDPINDNTTIKELSEIFKINRNKTAKIMHKLYTHGVYLQINYYSYARKREVKYWVLNPNICWRGRLVNDSIFNHFKDTLISKLI